MGRDCSDGMNERVDHFDSLIGTKRKILIVDGLIHPAALTIDFAMDNTIYWADHSLSSIEMMKADGSGRKTVVRGNTVDRPSSLDVFESSLYWISSAKGELRRQDKFGRGVMVRLVKDIASPSSVKGKRLTGMKLS